MSASDGGRRDDASPGATAVGWGLASLLAGTLALLLLARFFPGAILFAVVGGYLGGRARRAALADRRRRGLGLAWWSFVICVAAFALGLAIAVQAVNVLNDPSLLRQTLEELEASPTP